MQLVGVGVRRSVREVRVRFPSVTSNPSIDFFPFRVALSSVRLCTDGEEGRGKEGVK